MEIIRDYLDNMFAAYQATPEVEKLKSELLSTMEDRYLELKAGGHSETSAVGIVISDFGNIEELATEYGIKPVFAGETPPQLSKETAVEYLRATRARAICFSIAPFFTIVGIAVLFIVLAFDTNNIPGYICAIFGVFGSVAMLKFGFGLTKPFVYQLNQPYRLSMQNRIDMEKEEKQLLMLFLNHVLSLFRNVVCMLTQ